MRKRARQIGFNSFFNLAEREISPYSQQTKRCYGGIMIMICNQLGSISAFKVEHEKIATNRISIITFALRKETYQVVGVYLPTGDHESKTHDTIELLQQLTKIVRRAELLDTTLIIGGDFNAQINQPNSTRRVQEVNQWIEENAITRISNNSPTFKRTMTDENSTTTIQLCIDHIFLR
jgi:exonuclease III